MRQTRKNKKINLHDIHYRKPTKKDLAVGLVFFNSSKSVRLLTNYLYVVEKLKCAEIPYYTLEMYTDTPEIKDAFHIKTDMILFQKERLCHLLEKKIPATYTKLMFIDCDVIFDDESWYSKLSKALDTYEVIQPFSKVCRLDITYKKCLEVDSSSASYYPMKRNQMGEPGFVWAFQRNWFREKGFYQYAVLGGGDRVSSFSWLKAHHWKFLHPLENAKSRADYSKLVGNVKVSHLNGLIYHLFHGSVDKRQRGTRHAILKDYNDPKDAVRVTKSGAFTLRNKTLKSKVQKYFKGRDDDGI
jgi:hypothetical protein